MYPNDPGLKKKSSLKFLLVGLVPGILLGLFGSLVESSMKEPFKLMLDVWGLYTDFIPEILAKRRRRCGSASLISNCTMYFSACWAFFWAPVRHSV